MKNKSKKPSVGSMVKDSIGMMVTGGFGGTHGGYAVGATMIAKEKSKQLGGKGSKKRIGSKVF